ncbi:MAG: hypothetical protein AAGJ51_10465 [Pseudomonadota bacterium]
MLTFLALVPCLNEEKFLPQSVLILDAVCQAETDQRIEAAAPQIHKSL